MKTTFPFKRIVSGLGGLMIASASNAAIVNVTGALELISAPPSVVLNALQSSSLIRVFDEQQDLLLGNALAVDRVPPLFGTAAGSIAAGTRINSHFLHFDIVGTTATVLRGGLTFDGAILGLIFSNTRLSATDNLLGAMGTIYPTGANRGFEMNNGDAFTVSGDRLTFDFSSYVAGNNVDQIRVITAHVPEPGSLALAGLALCAVGVAGLRRRRAA